VSPSEEGEALPLAAGGRCAHCGQGALRGPSGARAGSGANRALRAAARVPGEALTSAGVTAGAGPNGPGLLPASTPWPRASATACAGPRWPRGHVT